MADPHVPDLRFDPPAPGSWSLDPVHFPRPVTRYWAETHPPAFRAGTHDFAVYFGMLIDGLETSYVNGFAYNLVKPAPEAEIPERIGRARAVMEGKLWRDQVHEWEETRKPVSIAEHRAIQAVEPDELSDDELAAYLTRCRDHHSAMITQHMRFSGSAMVPVGDFLVHVEDWTGRGPAELLTLTRGSAPVSAGSSGEHEALVATLRHDPAARALLESDGDPAQALDALRALHGDAGRTVGAYLDLVGYRPLDGFDISEPAALELPDALLRAMRGAVLGEGRRQDDLDVRISDVRQSVPEEHRTEFDELLGEARLTYHLPTFRTSGGPFSVNFDGVT